MSPSNPHVLGELSSYLDRALPSADTKRVETHLKSCLACQRHYDDLKALRQMLQSGPTYTPPESFYKGVMRRIEKPRGQAIAWNWNFSAKAFASACVVMLVIWVSHEVRQGKPPQTMARPEAPTDALQDLLKQNSPSQEKKGTSVEVVAAPAAVPLAERKDNRTQARGLRDADRIADSTPAAFGSVSSNFKARSAVTSVTLPEWTGMSSGISEARTVIIETPEDWQTLWKLHMSSATAVAPEIDFSSHRVIGVFSGQIAEIQETPTALIVLYREAPVPPHPYHLKVLPKTNLLIQFKKQ